MNSYPAPEDVLEDLGDKVVSGISTAVQRTADDLHEYRAWKPLWVAAHTERGLANWIHDRLWAHLVVGFDGVTEVAMVDKEPKREFGVGLRYRCRVKRHTADGAVRSYPTDAVLEFMAQPQYAFDGLELVHLIVGYRWDDETRTIAEAVISLHDGEQDVVWTRDLPAATQVIAPTSIVPPVSEPSAPTIEVAGDADEQTESGTGTS